MARALVIRPRCLLLDEPLSNLDAKLRLEMRTEIRRVCKEFNLTAIYVTHDQKEALSIANRMAVLDGGRIQQVGTPREVYRRPTSKLVADFIGETDFLPGQVVSIADGQARVATARRRVYRGHHQARMDAASGRGGHALHPPRELEAARNPGNGKQRRRAHREQHLPRRGRAIPFPDGGRRAQDFRAQPAF
ncbi:MAG: hypothetical protein QM796_17450 [Chthoniobacteraceae bacterium]